LIQHGNAFSKHGNASSQLIVDPQHHRTAHPSSTSESCLDHAKGDEGSHMRPLIIAYLVSIARKQEAVTFEQHVRLVHDLVRACARLSTVIPRMQTRPSWLAGFVEGEIA